MREIVQLYSDIERITGLPPVSGVASRRYAYHLIKALQKQYPNQDASVLAARIVQLAIELRDTWHSPKAHDPKHLFYRWQEIVQLSRVRSITPKPKLNEIADFSKE